MIDPKIAALQTQSLNGLKAHMFGIAKKMNENCGLEPDEDGNFQEISPKAVAEQFAKEGKNASEKRTNAHFKMLDEYNAVKARADMLEATMLASAGIGDLTGKGVPEKAQAILQGEQLMEAFHAYAFDIKSVKSKALDEAVRFDAAQRAVLFAAQQTTQTDATGGALLHPYLEGSITDALQAFGGVEKVANIINTGHGRRGLYPASRAHDEIGERINENTAQTNEPSDAFAQVIIDSYKYSSKRILIPYELLEDEEFPLLPWFSLQIIRRLGRIISQDATLGTNTNQPQGIVPGSKLGTTSSVANIFNRGDIVDLIQSVDQAYLDPMPASMMPLFGETMNRMMGKVGFLASRPFIFECRRLEDSEGRPLWLPSMRDGAPDMLEGYPYEISLEMADVATGNLPVLFGNMGYFTIRMVNGVRVREQNESLAHLDQIGIMAFIRMGAQYRLPADTAAAAFPVKHMIIV